MGLFCLLRYGLRLQSIVNCDRLWLTCCVLNNMLLKTDGLDKNWDTGVRSDWEDENNRDRSKVTPYVISRLDRPSPRYTEDNIDDSNSYESMGTHISSQCKKYTVNNKRVVAKMTLALFKRCLVNHFDIRLKKTILYGHLDVLNNYIKLMFMYRPF